MIKRRKTRQITVGDVKIGNGAPISVQSMTKTDTRDIVKTVVQIKDLERAGCEIVRVAVKDADAAKAIAGIKPKINIPLVADIHFDYRLALLAIQSGADKIRINPGNMTHRNEVEAVAQAAKARHIPIRIGLNSGSVIKQHKKSVADAMVSSAMEYIRLFEKMKFRDIVVSLKASDVQATVEAYRRIAKKRDYPLHLGVTAAGLADFGRIKSAVAFGALLLEGIGDTLRVSLTGDPILEVLAAKQILRAAGLASGGVEVISCPTCGRCQVDLVKIVEELSEKISKVTSHPFARAGKPQVKIAVMGCEVNGPGEARDADIGIAAGKNSGMLFKNGKPIKKIAEKDFVKVLLEEIKKL